MLLSPMIKRFFSTGGVHLKQVTFRNLRGKKVSSQQWLARQLTDPYIEKARMMNFRCRSAFKLTEIDDRFRILQPGFNVIDCGAAPGSWTQVAVNRVNANGKKHDDRRGKVISVDRNNFHPIDGAIILGNSDFTSAETQEKIKVYLGQERVDVVLSDMAPNATGIREMDVENILNLCYSTLRFALQVSRTGASLIVKLWQCKESKQLEDDISKYYEDVRVMKPNASRTDSAEIFLMAREFKGVVAP
ncbi:PREDICTED: rRNA methyltransferase 2, mitochondrial [Nicrophorus vespilloides]|uniref:rRNA methyltransferase 2, mitochondrial n=1 Tax=Nicrophorus vespilloides TaxID=110193 RepID=A0ABM1N5J0_NICVS|nr:PREDICTED: rRNA methyltransferase 2, mitochondrial [Nicrophorus vespilloides]